MQSGQDAQQQADYAIERDTSNLIIDITSEFNSQSSYEEAMMHVLELIGGVLHPDRLIIFERGEDTTSCSFEWHAENIPPQKANMQSIPNAQFDAMSRIASKSSPVLESNVENIEKMDEGTAELLNRRGIDRVMAIPLMSGGNVIGYLSANNYRAEQGIDEKRVLDAVAPFISTRIENQRLVTQLKLLGTHDELTGLLNRRGIDLAIEERLAAHPTEPYALALMDIDDFKIVNDLYGHEVGDTALKTLAKKISNMLPENAIIGRNGGDEFLAMLFGDDLSLIEPLRESFANASFECEHNGKVYPLSMSIGYAEWPTQAANLQEAYIKADAAVYAVKLAGKSDFRQYRPEYESQYRTQLGYTPRDIAENIPCGIAICKMSEVGEILYANAELVKMMECDSFIDFMEHTGGTFQGIVHPEDRSSSLQDLMRQHRNPALEKRAYINHRVITKTGTIRQFADTSRIVSTPNDDDVAYVLLVDLGERVRFLQLEQSADAEG